MTRRAILGIIGLQIFIAHPAAAQDSDWIASLSLRASYTSSSKLFLNPNALSSELRAQHDVLKDVLGAGLEIRFKGRESDFFLALTADALTSERQSTQLTANTTPPQILPYEDGFLIVPVELSANVYVPLGSEKVRLSMGGGAGAYYAERLLKLGDTRAPSTTFSVGYGIHVRSNFEYRLFSGTFLFFEMRFRDPEVEVINRFPEEGVNYRGVRYPQSAHDIKSKINVDGIGFVLGVTIEIL